MHCGFPFNFEQHSYASVANLVTTSMCEGKRHDLIPNASSISNGLRGKY